MNAHIQGVIRRLADPELAVAKDDQRTAAILIEQLDLMDKLVVTVPAGEQGILIIDATAITTDRFYPTKWDLRINSDGTWTHPPSDTTGPLSDHMRSIANACQDRELSPEPIRGIHATEAETRADLDRSDLDEYRTDRACE